MIPPGPTSAVVELLAMLNATFPPVGVQVVVGIGADTDSGVADSSPDVLLAGVGSVIVVVPETDSGPIGWVAWLVLLPARVRLTSAGMVFTPTVSRLRPYPASSTVGWHVDAEGGTASVTLLPSVTGFGVAAPAMSFGKDDVPAWAVLVHDMGVDELPVLAGVAPSSTGT